MKQLFNYEINCWYFFGPENEKEFMVRNVIAESDEKAKELGRQLKRTIFSVDIKSKTPYVEPKN
jgi:hypothetical protein